MKCEWCGSPQAILRRNGAVICHECRAGFEKPSEHPYRIFVIELLVIAGVVLLAWKFLPGFLE